MKPTEPLPIYHSWPIYERGMRFELGAVFGHPPSPPERVSLSLLDPQARAQHGIGLWECNLSDNSLTWSPEVYDIFGLPRNAPVRREDTLALYAENSRAIMERLRKYALKHRRGFTVDVEIRPASAHPRWMRLTGAPICDGNRVVRLSGLKQQIRT